MNMSPEEYDKLAKKASPNSPFLKNLISAFLIGGGICALGQGFLLWYQRLGIDRDTASAWASITLVFLSILLTGLDLYDSIAKVAGAGTLVPITGFTNSVAAPAIEYKKEGQVMGNGCKIFTIAGPVIL